MHSTKVSQVAGALFFGQLRTNKQYPFNSSRHWWTMTGTDPDELYTLRAQYWLGHFSLALEEAKSIMRRPMSPELKVEREQFMLRSQLAMGEYGKVISVANESSAPGT